MFQLEPINKKKNWLILFSKLINYGHIIISTTIIINNNNSNNNNNVSTVPSQDVSESLLMYPGRHSQVKFPTVLLQNVESGEQVWMGGSPKHSLISGGGGQNIYSWTSDKGSTRDNYKYSNYLTYVSGFLICSHPDRKSDYPTTDLWLFGCSTVCSIKASHIYTIMCLCVIATNQPTDRVSRSVKGRCSNCRACATVPPA